ncbi:ATPase, dynein-related, AAA domain containing protein [uncultured Caudovirales phage]|uniref:ATPase, dynein-related, AAA domain containing protein n=1 Tax=uncultured Caudovirales phage TaxID=2100421 RepID=A0A6J5NP95_9CAUD|nr:ATPase, dynein-related, AAA domain containing protein [uncultured Caudovirales phage]
MKYLRMPGKPIPAPVLDKLGQITDKLYPGKSINLKPDLVQELVLVSSHPAAVAVAGAEWLGIEEKRRALEWLIRRADTAAADGAIAEILKTAKSHPSELPNLATLANKHAGAAVTTRRLIGSFSLSALALLACACTVPRNGGEPVLRIAAAQMLLLSYEAAEGSWGEGVADYLGMPTAKEVAEECRANWVLSVTEILASLDAIAAGQGTGIPQAFGLVADELRKSLGSPAQQTTSVVAAPSNTPATPATTQATTPAAQPTAAQTTTTQENQAMTAAATTNTATSSAVVALGNVPAHFLPILDATLGSAAPGLSVKVLIDSINAMTSDVEKLTQAHAEELRIVKATAASASSQASITLPTQKLGGTVIPAGTVTWVEANSIFKEMKGISLKVPFFTWDSAHPDVPQEAPTYLFRKSILLPVLRALASGSECVWAKGNTGSGKTTLFEQIAARLNWPLARVAMDGNVDRSALVGRMNLSSDGNGGARSEWLPGVLETAIAGGYLLLLDELDAAHRNSIYAIQPLLEGKGLRILEDGGREVQMHPFCRILATGNTGGNGDDTGLYPATNVLSAATLDRFTEMVEVPYVTKAEEEKLLSAAAPALPAALVTRLAKFAAEMRNAFVNREIVVSFSPRRSMAMARAVSDYLAMGIKEDKALSLAAIGKVKNPAPAENQVRVSELIRTALACSADDSAE